jgi:5-methylcytosine-specific restriction endonuclease McrBC regulatory subunit McrC
VAQALRLNFGCPILPVFEKFVTKAFITKSRKLPGALTIGWQDSSLLSEPGSIFKLKVKPDITVRSAEQLVSIVDAKYKKAAEAYENHDFYQVISYATGLACPTDSPDISGQ